APSFQTNPNVFRNGILNDAPQAIFHALKAFGRNFFPFLHGTDFHSHVSTRQVSPGFRHRNQPISNWLHGYLSQMQYNEPSL
ncbi:MAG TPA: hypothetical protein VFU09_12100, partial [Candidatus Udaeobacter sp.]|nr:hypothetical protein [Candidatus Udaeobacter sp.]